MFKKCPAMEECCWDKSTRKVLLNFSQNIYIIHFQIHLSRKYSYSPAMEKCGWYKSTRKVPPHFF